MIVVACLASPAFASCDEPATGTSRAPVQSPPLGAIVTVTHSCNSISAATRLRVETQLRGPEGLDRRLCENGDGWTSGEVSEREGCRSDRLCEVIPAEVYGRNGSKAKVRDIGVRTRKRT
jgi:hypothetical protein